MRTTVSIDDDVLEVAKSVAEADRRTIGQVLSDFARKGMAPEPQTAQFRNGIKLMPVRPGAGRATLALVNRLRDEVE
ncbi:hypothetical protein [Sphingomonas sp. SUN039]|uniref:hypothetical protein n=1 Tax=Sphingomonas sp. SUN039 TaxID=2937787 RepID=UPI002164B120|nr:hypothetical protein [Sphingomonas sp. SUN039]UVO54435.1 hypothetical protein M0209_09985 [Sphingomonas sp. SUN039]